MAPSALSGTARDAGLDRRRQPAGEIRIADESHLEAGQRLLDQFGLMAGDDDHLGRLRGQRLFGDDPHQLLAVEFGEQLVGAAHPGRAAGGQHDRGDVAVGLDLGDGARLRPGDDFHQQTADAHAGEIGARDLEAGEQAHQHPVKAVFHRRARAARRAQHRHAAGAADQQEIAGIDRHAEMLDRAADFGDRGRDHVAAVGDRGRAEHDHEFGAEAEQFLDRRRQHQPRHAARGARR